MSVEDPRRDVPGRRRRERARRTGSSRRVVAACLLASGLLLLALLQALAPPDAAWADPLAIAAMLLLCAGVYESVRTLRSAFYAWGGTVGGSRPVTISGEGWVVVLRPGRAKLLVLLAASAAFTAGGVWLVAIDGAFGDWFALAFFGLCALLFAARLLLRRREYLRLSPEGLSEHSWSFRGARVALRWSDVRHFGVTGYGMVGFAYAAHVREARPSRGVSATLSGGYEATLLDPYGLPPREPAGLLNAYRELYGGDDPQETEQKGV